MKEESLDSRESIYERYFNIKRTLDLDENIDDDLKTINEIETSAVNRKKLRETSD